MQLYRLMQWDSALEAFKEASGIERFADQKTTPSTVYIERCHEFKQRPPASSPEEWDGVYRLTKKG
jgi:adenylate cyclase